MKEHPHQRLNRKRGIILRMSYVIAIGLVILAFQWKAAVPEPEPLRDTHDEMTFVDFVLRSQIKEEVPLPEPEQRPVKEQVLTPNSNINEVDDNKQVAPETTPLDKPNLHATTTPPIAEPDVVLDKPHRRVEVMPEYPGGMSAFYQFLQQHLDYPTLDRINGLEGRVYVQFIVEKDGSLTDFTIVRGGTPRMQRESIRVLQQMPAWIPGQQQGQKVRVYFVVPINFVLR